MGQPSLESKLETSLGYMRSSLKNRKLKSGIYSRYANLTECVKKKNHCNPLQQQAKEEKQQDYRCRIMIGRKILIAVKPLTNSEKGELPRLDEEFPLKAHLLVKSPMLFFSDQRQHER